MVEAPAQQISGVYHRRIGDIVVTALSDGYLDGTVDVLHNISAPDANQMLTDAFRPGRRTSVNCYAVYSAGAAGADRNRIRQLPATDRRQAAGESRRRGDRPGRDRKGDSDAHASRSLGPTRRQRQGTFPTPSWLYMRTSRATGRIMAR